MVSSRIDKYRDLRSGLKDEVGISRDNISNIVDDYDNDDADDFLASVNRFLINRMMIMIKMKLKIH